MRMPTIYIKSEMKHGKLAELIFGTLSNGEFYEYEELDRKYNYFSGKAFEIPISFYVVEGWDSISSKYPFELFLWKYSGPDGHEVDSTKVIDIIDKLKNLGLTFGVTDNQEGEIMKFSVYTPGREPFEEIIDTTHDGFEK